VPVTGRHRIQGLAPGSRGHRERTKVDDAVARSLARTDPSATHAPAVHREPTTLAALTAQTGPAAPKAATARIRPHVAAPGTTKTDGTED
jgi:hypothetical protein